MYMISEDIFWAGLKLSTAPTLFTAFLFKIFALAFVIDPGTSMPANKLASWKSIFRDEIARVSYLGMLKMSGRAISLFNWRTGLDTSLITDTVRETVKALTL